VPNAFLPRIPLFAYHLFRCRGGGGQCAERGERRWPPRSAPRGCQKRGRSYVAVRAGAQLVSQPPTPNGFVVVFSVGDANGVRAT
jgi:hypothetical protein